MSYPPVRYAGESGEVSAWLRPADTPPEVVYPNGNRVRYLARGEETGGLFGLYHWDFAGPRSGPDAHFHRRLTESFYVLSGTVTIYDGRDWVKVPSGGFVHVPAGGVHGFRNEDGAASMLLHFAPGACREPYFEGLARTATGERLTDAEYAAFMDAHDNNWVE